MTTDNSINSAASVPIPRTLETPPRTTGNVQQDLPLLIDWFYRAYQVITQSVAYINNQVNEPDFNVADLPDPSNTTLALAQETANNAYNLANSADKRIDGFIHGTFTIQENDVGVNVTFNVPQKDANYRVWVQATNSVGSPATQAFIVKQKTYTTTQFTVIMLGSPGEGNSVTYEWQLIRNS